MNIKYIYIKKQKTKKKENKQVLFAYKREKKSNNINNLYINK